MTGPGHLKGLFRIAEGQSGHACVMPMRRRWGKWRPETDGWGLLDARTKAMLVPPTLVTSEPTEMTDWEVHDLAVEFVCRVLSSEGTKIISSQGDPEIYPSVWLSRTDQAPAWIMIRAVRYPTDPRSVPFPSNWVKVGYGSAEFATRMAPELAATMGTRGYFAPIAIVRSDESFEDQPMPLLRGYSMMSTFSDLSSYHSDVFALTGQGPFARPSR